MKYLSLATILAAAFACTAASAQTHSADMDANSTISLSEVLRGIQFYNLDSLHCEDGTEDGYAPGDGAQDCTPHSSDYNPQDWSIDLSELLRLIQFFNAEGYIAAQGTEDGFLPVFSGGEGEGEGETEALQATLLPVADVALYENNTGALANGSGIYLFAGQTAVGELRRSAIRFDIAAALPTGAEIVSATLRMNLSRTNLDAGPQPFGLHRAGAAWNEGPSDAPGEEGFGAASETGDTTWLHRDYSDLLWTTPGGDYDATESATQTVNLEGFYSWSSAQLAVDVQNWLDTPASNHGWFLIGHEGTNLTAKRFDAREHPDTARRPALLIAYHPAE